MKSSLALVGFMGTGKTAVGKALAVSLCREFIELDAVIERLAGKSIPDIFTEDGEIRFRELEIEATRQVAGRRNAVIACGGGVVLNWINITRLREGCVVVLLRASPDAIMKRVPPDGGSRPLLTAPSRESIARMLALRKPFYDRAADFAVNTSRLTVSGVVDEIVGRLKHES